MDIQKILWGRTPDGKDIYKYIITNASGASVGLAEIGAAIVSINVPDREGILADVALGYEDPLSYIGDGPCLGKCPGRFANRIALGRFSLDGAEYTLPVNNGPNHLHGGPEGFQNHIWDSRIDGDAVEFMYFSEDGEQGYPGAVKAVVRYEWSEDNELRMTFTAICDAPTYINLTNHAYFNLDGEGSGTVLNHMLKLNCSEFLPTDATQIPLGDSEPVAGTPMDFINAKPVGRDINADYEPLKIGKGYDHCWVIDGAEAGQLQACAKLWSEKSGRFLEIITTQPGVQVYTGNWLGGCPAGKSGHVYADYDGIAIECQHFPDSPNKPEYPTTVLRPGETYEQAIIYAFKTL